MSRLAPTVEKCTFLTGCVPSVDTMEGVPLSLKSRNKIPHIGIDLLGGDHTSSDYVAQTLQALFSGVELPLSLTLFTTPELSPSLKALNIETLHIIETTEVITMDDDPLQALRKKKGSSMHQGLHLLKEGKIDAFLSTGNTGALVGAATMSLSKLPGISRSALITLLPTQQEPVAVIDVGANIECTPEHLVQFAKMGRAFQKSRGIPSPKIGLLNIGTEEKKGRTELRETYQLLQELNTKETIFAGNIEGKEVFSGNIHVLVTDGFTGNVFLKTAEGISSFILETMRQNKSLLPFSKALLNRLEAELYSAESPGAILCGVNGIVLKCHGDATPAAIASSTKSLLTLIENNFLDTLTAELSASAG